MAAAASIDACPAALHARVRPLPETPIRRIIALRLAGISGNA